MATHSDAGTAARQRRFTAKRKRRVKPDADIVLICNPRAGGRWKELAPILDSEEARHARRIVTDSVEDIAMALDDLGHDAKLICIYGGDGTIQRLLDRLAPDEPHGGGAVAPSRDAENLYLAMLGGGTMNVTSRWCGFSSDPGRNFRQVVRAFRSGELLLREVPVLEITVGGEFHRGFTFGMGPIVRVLDVYERGPKGKVAAVATAARAIAATWLRRPAGFDRLLEPMKATIELDGEKLPYEQFSAVFANVTGQINPGIEPFVGDRTRDSFHCAAYAVGVRELSLALPRLARGWLPMDIDFGGWTRRSGELPKLTSDARYVNRPASRLSIHTQEQLYTVDGELLRAGGRTLEVTLGPTLKLAVGTRAGWRMAVDAITPGS